MSEVEERPSEEGPENARIKSITSNCTSSGSKCTSTAARKGRKFAPMRALEDPKGAAKAGPASQPRCTDTNDCCQRKAMLADADGLDTLAVTHEVIES